MDEESNELRRISRSDLSALHQEVADDLFKKHGEWEVCVKRAFDVFDGDFDQFQQSLCFKLLVEQQLDLHLQLQIKDGHMLNQQIQVMINYIRL